MYSSPSQRKAEFLKSRRDSFLRQSAPCVAGVASLAEVLKNARILAPLFPESTSPATMLKNASDDVKDSGIGNKARYHHVLQDFSSNAFANIFSSKLGPNLVPPNPKLKLLLTSSGLMPDSAPTQLEAYRDLVASAEGNAILFLLDAKLLTLQFTALHSDPAKSNDQKMVAYRREPDEPGGMPVYDKTGGLLMKSQAELLADGYGGGTAGHASPDYSLRHVGHFSNGHLEILSQGKPNTPIFLSYLWDEGHTVDGIPQYSIFVMQGYYTDGVFTAQKVTGEDFSESDYELLHYPRNTASDRFGKVSTSHFAEIVSDVKTVMACGGTTFRAIQALSPFAMDAVGRKLDHPNLYGRVILDRVKSGKAVYVGQSAGTVALSFIVGPLTTDPILRTSSESDLVKVRQPDDEAGFVTQWLFPGISHYLGMPYHLLLRPHLTFDPHALSFGKNILGLERVIGLIEKEKTVRSLITHSMYAAVIADYNYASGKGDILEISGGQVRYHVGYSDEVDFVPNQYCQTQFLNRYAPVWADKNGALRRQPLGNSPRGQVFDWTPEDGDVFAAGPLAKQQFRIYASSSGPIDEEFPNETRPKKILRCIPVQKENVAPKSGLLECLTKAYCSSALFPLCNSQASWREVTELFPLCNSQASWREVTECARSFSC